MRDEASFTVSIDHLLCPITQDIMTDPVMAADGHTYERAAFEEWIKTRGARAISPLTGERLTDRRCQSNVFVKRLIIRYNETQPEREQRALTEHDLALAIQLREEEWQGLIEKPPRRMEASNEPLKESDFSQTTSSFTVDSTQPHDETLMHYWGQLMHTAQAIEVLTQEHAASLAQRLLLTTAVADLVTAQQVTQAQIETLTQQWHEWENTVDREQQLAQAEAQAARGREKQSFEQAMRAATAAITQAATAGQFERIAALSAEPAALTQAHEATLKTLTAQWSAQQWALTQRFQQQKAEWEADINRRTEETLSPQRLQDYHTRIEQLSKQIAAQEQRLSSLWKEHLAQSDQANRHVKEKHHLSTEKIASEQKRFRCHQSRGIPGKVDYEQGVAFFLNSQYPNAVSHFEAAAKRNYPAAYLWLGGLYDAFIFPREAKTSEQWYKKAQAHIAWFQSEAAGGQPDAQNNLAMCYERGIGVAKDLTQAFYYSHLAAEQGDPIAQCNVGACYHQGQGVSQDYPEGIRWMRLSAEQGFSLAQFMLGVYYQKGQGVSPDEAEAARWYQLSAEQGCAPAQCLLGLYYGNGANQDHTEAVQWFQRSAEQGFSLAQFLLGVYYEKGRGVAPDRAEALRWYQLAAAQGDEDAITAQRRLEQGAKTGGVGRFFGPAPTPSIPQTMRPPEKEGCRLM